MRIQIKHVFMIEIEELNEAIRDYLVKKNLTSAPSNYTIITTDVPHGFVKMVDMGIEV